MSTNPGSESKRTALAAAGFLLVPIVCCGLPVLIAAGALGAVGSVLGNPGSSAPPSWWSSPR